MGVWHVASHHVDFAHAGRAILRKRPVRAAFCESAFACGELGVVVFRAQAIYGRVVAERFCSGVVCSAPGPGGIGSVGGGAKGRVEHVLRVVVFVGVRKIRVEGREWRGREI